MTNKNFLKNKEGVESVVAYMFLIIIGLAISAFVYIYLTYFLPTTTPTCPEDMHISIEDVFCSTSTSHQNLSITLANRGLWTIRAVYIRFGESTLKVRNQVPGNKENPFIVPPLLPQDSKTYVYNISSMNFPYSSGVFIVEVQPAFAERNKLYPCPKAIVTREVVCT